MDRVPAEAVVEVRGGKAPLTWPTVIDPSAETSVAVLPR